jgi:hypothetical protein
MGPGGVDFSIGLAMAESFDRAANSSPRSGSSKRVTPIVWAAVLVVAVAMAVWFAMK